MALAFDIRVGDLNWLFLVYAIAVVVVILFYLFYFGRLFASILSLILRTILWRRFKVWVDIGSAQFSPLGGRLLLRDVRYVGENQSINIVMGSITWRYWLWRVRQDEDLRREDSRLPCRTSIKLEGAEWFIYNRNAAFDMLLERLSRRESDVQGDSKPDSGTTDKGSVRILPPSNENHMKQDPNVIDWFRETLPLELNVVKGAMVMGNRSTPSLVVAGFHSAVGTCGAVKSRSALDFYKQVYQFTFSHPRILLRKNHDFEEPLLAHGARMRADKDNILGHDIRPPGQSLERTAFQELVRRWTVFAEYIYTPKPRSVRLLEQQASEWHGLDRYRQAVDNLHGQTSSFTGTDKQYAKVSTIYDNGKSIDLTYYADVAGYVPEHNAGPVGASVDKPDIGNGDLSPEWGVDIRLNGGQLTYGPWTDRQRVAIQNAFFPPAHFNTESTPYLQPGDRRLHAALKIFVDFSESLTFRLPTRESTKDWKYDGRDPVVETSRRPYGWLDMALGPDSSFTFALPMTAGPEGYETFLEVHLDSLKIFSSVNYEKFVEAKSCRVSCQLPQPLVWDALHDWKINVSVERPEIYFLRDHAYLITDLVRDWTSGEPVTYNRFVPFTYGLNLTCKDYRLYLYLNDCNIVNNPSSLEDNTLLLIEGPKLKTEVDIPSDRYCPLFSTMTAGIEVHDISLSMSAPASNTHQAWLTSRTASFGKIDLLKCSLSHTMFSESHPDNVETLDIDLLLDGVLFEALGWALKYLIEIKDNYFGTFNNFSTSAELDSERNKSRSIAAFTPLQRKHELNPVDAFEVTLKVESRNGVILLPEELHDCKSGLVIDVPELSVHLRNQDAYMELAVDIDPMIMLFANDFEELISARLVPAPTSHNRVLLDGLVITAHRLFGPQPLTSTYVAMWEFSLGRLSADVTIPHFASLQRIARTFASNFVDEDNSISRPIPAEPLPDVTFLCARLEGIEVNVWSQDSAVVLAAPQGLAVKFNDYISEGALSRVTIDSHSIQARGLVQTSTDHWLEVTSVEFGIAVNIATSESAWKLKEVEQQRFLAEQDTATGRCEFLYSQEESFKPPPAPGSLSNISLQSGHDLAYFRSHGPATIAPWYHEQQDRSRKESTRSYGTAVSGQSTLSYGTLLQVFRLVPGCTASGVDGSVRVSTFIPEISTQQADEAPASRTVRDTLSPLDTYSPAYENERVTYMQVDVNRTVKLLCSPKAVKLAEDVVASLEKNFEPEHWVDELDDMFRKALPVQVKPERHESLYTDFRIASISLLLVQDVLRPGDLDLPQTLGGELNSDASILSTSQLVLKNLRFSALSVQGFQVREGEGTLAHHIHDPSARYRSISGKPVYPVVKRKELNLRAGKARLTVKHIGSAASDAAPTAGIPLHTPGTLLETLVDGIEILAELPDQYQRVSAKVLGCNINAVSSAAELVTGTIHSWFIVSRAIETAVHNAHYRPISSYRRLVTDILQLAHKEEVVTDPLFLNRPTSAAVHLRSNTDWKIMAHVRHVLRRLTKASQQQLQNSFNSKIDPFEDFRNMVSRLQEWHNWELDEMVIRRLPLIQFLFTPEELPRTPQGQSISAANTDDSELVQQTDVELLLTTSRFTVSYFEEGACTNKLVISPSELYAVQNTSKDSAALLRVTMGPIWLSLDPGVLRLIIHISKVRHVFSSKLQPLIPRPYANQQPRKARARSNCASQSVPLRLSILLEAIDVSTHASGVRASVVLQSLCAQASTTFKIEAGKITPGDSQMSLSADTVKLLALLEGRVAQGKNTREHSGTLISIQFEGVCTHTIVNMGSSTPKRHLHFTGMITSSRIRIPRSILKMSQFIEQWRAESLPQSKIAFEALRRDVEHQTTELAGAQPAKESHRITSNESRLRVSVFLHMPIINFHIRAAQKFWLDYHIGRMALHWDGTLKDSNIVHAQSALKLESQAQHFIAVNDPSLQGEGAPFGGESIHFPAILVAVKYDGAALEVLASLERIALTITASILDSALTVQKRFEHDIDEILAVFAQHKAKRRAAEVRPVAEPISRLKTLKWSGQVILRGLNLGLRGPLSTQYIGADFVDGHISHIPGEQRSDTHWEVNASNLALSLAQEASEKSTDASFDRTYRLAYFVLDIQAGNRVAEVEELKELTKSDLKNDHQTSHLHIKVAKTHAVMRTAAIEALDDLLDHFMCEIRFRRQARSTDLSAIKEKVIMTFDIPEKPSGPLMLPWIERCVLSLRINDVGIAIPLEDIEIEAPFFGHPLKAETRARPAFLVSTPSLLFATSKGSAGIASITDLSAQFVSEFDQTKARDFSGFHHDTRNRLLLPLSAIKISTDVATASKAKAFTINARMSGAQLDIDGTAPVSVFALLELYELSYKRLARHAPEPITQDVPGSTSAANTSEPENDIASFFDSTTFEATFEVESGVVRMHSRLAHLDQTTDKASSAKAAEAHPKTAKPVRSKPTPQRQKEQYFGQGNHTSATSSDIYTPEHFIIPKMTMWSVKKNAVRPGQANILHLDALIHSSRNILRPTLLPFLSEISEAIKVRMQKQDVHEQHQEDGNGDDSLAKQSDLDHTQIETTSVAQESVTQSGFSDLRNLSISVSLRIDKSSLQLNCGKIAPVSAGLDWQSGGLMVILQPGSRSLHVSLRVDEVGFDVRHAYSPERCLTGSAHGLVIAFSLSPTSNNGTLMTADFDVSSIAFEVNFRQLQDFLCFKALWLDRLEQIVPLAEGQNKPTLVAKDATVRKSNATMTTAVLARVQQIKMTFMLGHSIGTVDISASMLLGRLHQVPLHSRSFSVDLQTLEILAKGRLAGNLKTDGLYFETSLHDIVHAQKSDLQNCTNISAFIGKTDASLEFDYRKTLLMRTEPIRLGVIDNWTRLTSDNELGLEFSLRFGSFNVIVTTQTIPTIVKLGKDMERLIEDRRTKARTILQSQVSSKTATKLVSAKIDLKEARETWKAGAVLPSAIPEGTKVVSRIELEADRLRFAVFLHHFTDQEAFRADAGEVKAVLSRTLNDQKVVRDLDLHLGFFSVIKIRPKQRVTPAQEQENSIQDWFDLMRIASDRNIFKFPTSQAKMASTQEDNTNRIYHRFSLVFTGQVDISLNYALLKQLGALLAAYHDGMKRIGDDEAAENAGPRSAEPTPVATTFDNPLEGDADGPSKRVLASNIPPPQAVDVVGSREYIALENNIQQPQLQLLGEATPPLEWLGLQRSHMPALVHEGCTLILESALLELSAVYRRSLSKAASIS